MGESSFPEGDMDPLRAHERISKTTNDIFYGNVCKNNNWWLFLLNIISIFAVIIIIIDDLPASLIKGRSSAIIVTYISGCDLTSQDRKIT